jgi:hypothetical protein
MKLILLLFTTMAFITEPTRASHLRKYQSNINQQISMSEKKRDVHIDVVKNYILSDFKYSHLLAILIIFLDLKGEDLNILAKEAGIDNILSFQEQSESQPSSID